MKVVPILIAALSLAIGASGAWARLGDTAQEAEKRYGTDLYTNGCAIGNGMTNRLYRNGDIEISATFFPSKSGKSVIGMLTFKPTTSNAQEHVMAALPEILKANGDGGNWEATPFHDNSMGIITDYVDYSLMVGGKFVATARQNNVIGDRRVHLLMLRLQEYTDYIDQLAAKAGKQKGREPIGI